MKKSKLYRLVLVAAIFLGLASVGMNQVAADSTESGNATVSFTHPTLNPSNPRLPLADTNGETANTGTPGRSEQTVAVDTTPEKTKVTDNKVTASSSSRTKLPATDAATRTKLPQTGVVTIPAPFVLIAIALSLMLGTQVLRHGREIA